MILLIIYKFSKRFECAFIIRHIAMWARDWLLPLEQINCFPCVCALCNPKSGSTNRSQLRLQLGWQINTLAQCKSRQDATTAAQLWADQYAAACDGAVPQWEREMCHTAVSSAQTSRGHLDVCV